MVVTKTVLGLDLGSHSLKAVELRSGLRGLEPGQAQMKEHSAASESDLPGETIRRFIDRHALSTENTTCALSGQRTSNRRLEFPFRDRKKLAQAIPFEIEGAMPFDFDDLVVDWQLVAGERNHGVVAASVAQKQDVSEFLATLEAAGCSPRVLETEGLVLGNLAAVFDLPGVRLLADLGHLKTTVCLCVDGKPIAGRTVPVGGMAISEAIAKAGNLDLEEAERLKCETALFAADDAPARAGAVAVVDRIARELVRSLESLDPSAGSMTTHPDCEIVLMGGTAKLTGIEEYLEARIGVPTRRIRLPEDPAKASLLANGDPLLFAPALALAIRSTGQSLSHFNFRQDEFSFRSSYAWLLGPQLRPTLVLALTCLILMGVSGAVSLQLEASHARSLERQMAHRYSLIFPEQAVPSQPLAALAQEVSSARERANFLGLYGGNLSALDLLTLLSELIPLDLTLKFDEISIDQNVIRIKVAAQNYEAQDRLENVLKAEPVFAAADVTGSAKRLKDGSVTFGLSIPLDQSGENL